MARQRDLSQRLRLVVVLIAGLVAPTADEIARGFDLNQEIAAGLLVQGFTE